MRAQAIFHNGKGRGSHLIKWATRSRFSHESIRFIDVTPDLIRWASMEYGLVITPDHEFESIQGIGVHDLPFRASKNQCWKDFEHTEEQAEIMFKEACSLVGKKYDWRGIGGFVTRRDKHHPDKWFCSEYGCHIRRKAGILTQNVEDHHITPRWSAASVIFNEAKTETS